MANEAKKQYNLTTGEEVEGKIKHQWFKDEKGNGFSHN